ncbi:MAG: histidine kinase [Tannerella sp.]|nr:histidine kinase [Tannerella sp.]
MNILDKHTPFKIFLISLISAVFITYPNIVCLPWELDFLKGAEYTNHLLYFTFRYLFFCILIFILLMSNMRKLNTLSFKKRFLYNAFICLTGYGVFVVMTVLFYSKASHFGSVLVFQFFVVCFLSTFMGHTYQLYSVQRKKEQEIEHLKMINLQSRYDALMSQINPHFFFNSLNGLTALIRKKNDENTLTYVNKMSDVFRYILQSDKKGLVTLGEELEFVDAFFYMMEVRFANKLEFKVDVDPEMISFKLPVLSILPIVENVVVHNRIDSEHKMVVTIRQNEQKELVISNPIYPKLSPPETNGTGLENLNNRFSLLMNRQIRTKDDGDMFYVYLPLFM